MVVVGEVGQLGVNSKIEPSAVIHTAQLEPFPDALKARLFTGMQTIGCSRCMLEGQAQGCVSAALAVGGYNSSGPPKPEP